MNPFRSKLGALNFLVLQWFFVRLADVGDQRGDVWVHERWMILRWIVPMTGWWTKYIYVRKVA